MAVYSGSYPIFQVANNTPAADLMTGQSNEGFVVEIGAQVGTAAVTVFGIGRSPAPGVQVGGQALISEDISGFPCQTICGTQWSRAPTVPSIYLRRLQISGTAIGQQMILTFPRGLPIGYSSSLVFWNLTTTQAAGTVIWAKVDE